MTERRKTGWTWGVMARRWRRVTFEWQFGAVTEDLPSIGAGHPLQLQLPSILGARICSSGVCPTSRLSVIDPSNSDL